VHHLDGLLDALCFEAFRASASRHRLDKDTSGVLMWRAAQRRRRRLADRLPQQDGAKVY